MFTGIVEEMGCITDREERGGLIVMTVEAPTLASGLGIGSSIAVSGVCLTVTHLEDKCFRMDVSNETARRTNLGRVEVGGKVNLELPLRVNDQLGGHIVQGHVDEVGTILSSVQQGGDVIMRIEYPRRSDPYVVEKGSNQVLPDVPVRGVGELQGMDHSGQGPTHEDNISRLHGHIGPRPQGDSYIGLGQGRRVVHPVPHHGHTEPLSL